MFDEMSTPHLPKMTSSMNENKVIQLEIIREAGDMLDPKADWLNRFIRNPETKEILYYCESSPNHKFMIHRGGIDGEIIAQAVSLAHEPEGETTIQLHEITTLQHKHHKVPSFHSRTNFLIDGKPFHWKGHTQLFADESSEIVAEFHPTWFEGSGHRIGRLDVFKKWEMELDVIVVTALIVQERSDEHKLAAERAQQQQSALGVTKMY